jgi:putative ABC transport system substrate-binding protein
MRRRQLIGAAFAAIATLPAAITEAAEPPYRVGIITPAIRQWDPEAFSGELRNRGYVEGRNLVLDVHSAEGRLERLPALAAALVASQPDVIVAVNTPGARAAIAATKTIPIVMAVVGDPVGMGFVNSLARPGGNVTGVSNLSAELAAKRLSLLKEVAPTIRRVAILFNPIDPITVPQIHDTENAAPLLDVEIRLFPVKEIAELNGAFERLLEWRADAALWLAGQAATLELGTVDLALKANSPVMYALNRDVRAGVLISYFADYAE